MGYGTISNGKDLNPSRRNLGRGLLVMQASFVFIAGMAMLVFPEQGCTRWVWLRGIEAGLGECPQYTSDHAVAALYNFSLSKHHAMLGIMFCYIAIMSNSRSAINIGFIYMGAAMSIDSLPGYTWLSASVDTWIPPITRAGFAFIALSTAGIIANSRHPEWRKP